MQFNPNEIVQLFVCVQCLLFSVILLTDRSKNRTANWFLAAFLCTLALQMAVILAEKWVVDYEFFGSFLCLFGFAYGPLLYLYTVHVAYRDFDLRPAHALHAIPFLIVLVSSLVGYGLCYKIGSLLYISLIAYVVLSIRQILTYRAVVRNTRSTIDRINLSWLQWTMIIFTITLLTDIYSHFYDEIELIPGISIVSLSLLILVNGIFYKGLKQPQVFQGVSKADQQVGRQGSQVSSEDFEAEAERIAAIMNSEKPYIESDLTLADLAERLEMPPRKLSEVINRHFGQNFMDFVNTHRIDYARERLVNPVDPKETILEVMYDVGFHSKSSFNTLFKQKTGMTPSEYKKKHR